MRYGVPFDGSKTYLPDWGVVAYEDGDTRMPNALGSCVMSRLHGSDRPVCGTLVIVGWDYWFGACEIPEQTLDTILTLHGSGVTVELPAPEAVALLAAIRQRVPA
jgi:hypothetical protein